MGNFNVVGLQRKPQKRAGFSDTFKAAAGEALANMLISIPGQALSYGVNRGLQEVTNDPNLLAQKEAVRAARLAGDKSAADLTLMTDTYDAQMRTKLAELASAESEAALNNRILGTLGSDIIGAKKAGLVKEQYTSGREAQRAGASRDALGMTFDDYTAMLTGESAQDDFLNRDLKRAQAEQAYGAANLSTLRGQALKGIKAANGDGKGGAKAPPIPKAVDLNKIMAGLDYKDTANGRELSPLGVAQLKSVVLQQYGVIDALRKAGRNDEANALAYQIQPYGTVAVSKGGVPTVELVAGIEKMGGAPAKAEDPDLIELKRQLMTASVAEKKAGADAYAQKAGLDRAAKVALYKELKLTPEEIQKLEGGTEQPANPPALNLGGIGNFFGNLFGGGGSGVDPATDVKRIRGQNAAGMR